MKELDAPTENLIRYLAKNRLREQYPKLKFHVVWVGGDEKTLKRWAEQNGVSELLIGIIATEDETLKPWRISRKVGSTTVLLHRRVPLAVLVDFEKEDLGLLDKKMEENGHWLGRRREGPLHDARSNGSHSVIGVGMIRYTGWSWQFAH